MITVAGNTEFISSIFLVVTFSSMTSLGQKVSMSGLGRGVDVVTKTKGNTNIRNLRSNTTSSVEDSGVSSTSERFLFKRRQDISGDTL